MARVKLRFRPSAWWLCLTLAFCVQAEGQINPWSVRSGPVPNGLAAQTWIQPDAFLPLDLDQAVLENILSQAPKETPEKSLIAGGTIILPLPDGSFSTFRFVESPVMALELAAQFPEIRTFV